MISVPEEDQRSEIRLGSKLDGWMEEREVEMQGAGTGELVMHEWWWTAAAGDSWSEQRPPAGSRQVCRLNEWGKLEQSLELYLGVFLKILVYIPFGDFLPEQRS